MAVIWFNRRYVQSASIAMNSIGFADDVLVTMENCGLLRLTPPFIVPTLTFEYFSVMLLRLGTVVLVPGVEV